MKYSLLLVALISATSLMAEETVMAKNTGLNEATKNIKVCPECTKVESIREVQFVESKSAVEKVLTEGQDIRISVSGQGVAPMNTASPAQAYALAKRAATADAYRLIAEKVKGVRIEGQDLIKNMMVQRSTIRTSVNAMVRNANVVETTFKEGLCEVEMEILISHSQFAQ
ncbi:MAG: hypothetical protein AUK54_08540 [Helicobacteraceae bacterium CG2_30_36_10]|nr:MAG: hypothetical protein AUK54_08540 [Helicobacteraceae bacterium CG2_30_36_10]